MAETQEAVELAGRLRSLKNNLFATPTMKDLQDHIERSYLGTHAAHHTLTMGLTANAVLEHLAVQIENGEF